MPQSVLVIDDNKNRVAPVRYNPGTLNMGGHVLIVDNPAGAARATRDFLIGYVCLAHDFPNMDGIREYFLGQKWGEDKPLVAVYVEDGKNITPAAQQLLMDLRAKGFNAQRVPYHKNTAEAEGKDGQPI